MTGKVDDLPNTKTDSERLILFHSTFFLYLQI
jgi:hypothetical protein